jgi:hypothetical protein
VTSGIQSQFTTVNTSLSGKASTAGNSGQAFSVATPTSNNHASTKAYAEGTKGSNYVKLPNGVAMCWGKTSGLTNNSYKQIDLPITYTDTSYTITTIADTAHNDATRATSWASVVDSSTIKVGKSNHYGEYFWQTIGQA